MKTLVFNLPVILCTLIIFSGCQNRGHNILKHSEENQSKIGKTGESIKLELGEPLGEEPSEIMTGATIFLYPDNTKIQLENGKVVAVFSNPEIAAEKNIQYWYHKLKDDDYEIVKTIDPKTNKSTKKSQLVCRRRGLNIIFDEESGNVTRIIDYEKM